jgi:hypothetical protein
MKEQLETITLGPPEPISAELALKHFEAECKFNAALAQFQSGLKPVPDLSMATVVEAAKPAFKVGFSWIVRQDADRIEVCIRHSGGAEEYSISDAATLCSPSLLLAGLLGISVEPPVPVQASNTEQQDKGQSEVRCELYAENASSPEQAVEEVQEPGPVEVENEPVEEEPDVMGPDSPPEISGDHRSLEPLTPKEIATAIKMVQVMPAQQRKSLTIAFRNAFNVPRTTLKIIGEITQKRHLDFIDRFTCEAAGIPSP